MNANWNLPALGSIYTDTIAIFNSKLEDVAKGLDTTATNLPVNSIKWSSSTNNWQKYNGTTWAALSTAYAITATAAQTWSTARNLAIIGDGVATLSSVNGSGNVTATLTLATVNSNVGSFGSSSALPILTVNTKGLITAITTTPIGSMALQASTSVSITGGAISGLTSFVAPLGTADTATGRLRWNTATSTLSIGTGASSKTLVDLDSTQTLTNKTWNGVTIAVAKGGTGADTPAGARTNLGVDEAGTAIAMAIALG